MREYAGKLLDKAGASVAAEAAILTEGDRAQWMHIHSLGQLPLFTGSRNAGGV